MGKILETRKLYKEVINSITKTEDDWISFLNSSSWHFKYDFVDKVLIYAQKPEAKACAEMKEWNSKVRRWVNKDAEGIFVISKDDNNPYPFRLVLMYQIHIIIKVQNINYGVLNQNMKIKLLRH